MLTIFQNFLMNLSAGYINCPLDNVDRYLQQSLQEVGYFVDVDRVYIFNYDFVNNTTSNTLEWCRNNIESQRKNLQNVNLDDISDWVDIHKKGKLISIPDVSNLDKNNKVKEILIAQNIKSLITLPMMVNKQCIGFVGFDSVKKHHFYTDREVELLEFYAKILVNINERKKRYDELRRARIKAEEESKIKNWYIAKISHELRNPLNGVYGFLNLIKDSVQLPKEKDYVRKASTSLNLVLKIVNDLLDISKIEANKLEFVENNINIHNLIKETIDPYLEETSIRNIELDIRVDTNIPQQVVGDSDRIKQILSNIIGNAIMHANPSNIEIKCRINKKGLDMIELIFTVKDNGIGIRDKEAKNIFEPFYKIKNSSAGSGLGLPICKELVNKMNGKIWLESVDGQGSTFFLKLPFRIATIGQRVIEYKGKYKELKGLRILLAEDDEINQELVKQILYRKGIFVNAVSNGVEALKALKENHFDLILMDIQMSIMNGLETTQKIRKAQNEIPIIALTGAVLPEEKNKYYKCGINGIVEKPIFVDSLMKEIYLKVEEANMKDKEK